MTGLIGLFAQVLICTLAIAPLALAQTPSADPPSVGGASAEPGLSEVEPPGRDAPDEVEEITVTGTRSDATDIQREAAAITAFSMEDLDRANIVNVDQLAFNVPALHVGQQGANSIITLRGISTENASIAGEPGVAFHVDGVNYARPSAARVAFFDLEGLQVLRGPQGYEGGKNSTAGWIHAITHKPTDELSANVDVQWGSYDQLRFRGALNIPISEYALTRFAFYREERDGYQRNLFFNDEDRNAFDADDFGWRAHLRLLPRDDLDLLFTYNYYESKGVGAANELVAIPPDSRCNNPPAPYGSGFNPVSRLPVYAGCGFDPNRGVQMATGFDLEDLALTVPGFGDLEPTPPEAKVASHRPHELYLEQANDQENIFWGFTQTTTWDVPDLPLFGKTQLKSIGSFQLTELNFFGDVDSTDIDLFFGHSSSESNQFSHELQWSGEFGESLEWQLGTFWMRETSEADTDFRVRLLTVRPLLIFQSTENQSYGLSATTTWSIRDNLALTLGGRYTKDRKRSQILRDNPVGSQAAFPFGMGVCTGSAPDLVGATVPGRPGLQRGDGFPDTGLPWCEQTFRHTTGNVKLQFCPTE